MPKPRLTEQNQILESQMIETFLAGHHEYRPDLAYPESHSDMAGGVRALLRRFEVKMRPLDVELPVDDNL